MTEQAKPTSLVSFWAGAEQCENFARLPHFTFSKIGETTIASWLGLHSRVLRKEIHYEDGTVGEVTKPMETSESLVPAFWDVERDSENPHLLSRCVAVQFPQAVVSESLFRDGEISTWDVRTDALHLLLRLTAPGMIEPVRDIRFTPDGSPRLCTSVWDIRLKYPIRDWLRWNCSVENRVRLLRLSNCFWSKLIDFSQRVPDDCLVPCRYFVRAIMRPSVDQEIYLWIALESMFNPSDRAELSNRIAQFASLFTASKSERWDRYDFLKSSYINRSKHLHGSDRPSKIAGDVPYAEMYAKYLQLEEIVRAALRRYLRCRICHHISRDKLHDYLNRACFDDSILDSLPVDPIYDQAFE